MSFKWILLFVTIPLFAKELLLVSILPQKYFLEQIVGKRFAVEAMIPPGASPATYSLKPSELQKVKKAKLYFTIGVPFEKAWLNRFASTNPNLSFIDCGKYIRRYPLQEGAAHLDPHIWLAPNYVMQIARAMLDAVIALDKKNAKEYLKNYKNFIEHIAAIDTKIYRLFLQKSPKAFVVYHPSFGYFARSYGLRQIAIEKEGKEPKIKDLVVLIKKAKKLQINTIFIEPQFPKKRALLLAKKLGAKVVTIDPLAYDWSKNILKVACAISGNCD